MDTLLPYLLPTTSLSCKAINCFLQELFTFVLFKPLVERSVDPDFLNKLLLVFLNETPVEYDTPDATGHDRVAFLAAFSRERSKYVSQTISVDGLIHDATFLYPFMQFLKTNGALNVLQFALSVEEFNQRSLASHNTDVLDPQVTKK